ncbi:MBL fold metallo-hydrolase [Nocardia sp. NPDC004654]|uniref:MBL fold metallo-hydrolase n=1 Tax=Nocardia sp. NPDC004654 TaxID=3154776 RepID=UPI0033A1C878
MNTPAHSDVNTTGRLADQAAVRQLRMGDVTFTYVVDGAMALSPSLFFPSVPQQFWDQNPEFLDTGGRIPMSAGGLLIERDGHYVLIDTGVGEMAIDTPEATVDCGAMPAVLEQLGVALADVDVVAFTHSHFDHTGWAIRPSVGGTSAPMFANARYLVGATEWGPFDCGLHPAGSPDPLSVIAPLRALSHSIDDGAVVAPGITALATPGHSAGHISYVVTTSAGCLLAFGDGFHTPAQLSNPEWCSAADADPASARDARQRLLEELSKPDTVGFGIHFGDQPFGRIAFDSSARPVWQPIPSTVVRQPPRPSDNKGKPTTHDQNDPHHRRRIRHRPWPGPRVP